MRGRWRQRPALSLGLALWLAFVGAAAHAQDATSPPPAPPPPTVFVVVWAEPSAAERGLIDALAHRGIAADVALRSLGADGTGLPDLLAELRDTTADLIYVRGWRAAEPLLAALPADAPPVLVYGPQGPQADRLPAGLTQTGAVWAIADQRVPPAALLAILQSYHPVLRLGVLRLAAVAGDSVAVVAAADAAQLPVDVVEVPVAADGGLDRVRLDAALATLAEAAPDFVVLDGMGGNPGLWSAVAVAARQAGLPTAVTNPVFLGSLLTLRAPAYTVGRLAGAQAAEILRGVRPARRSLAHYQILINRTAFREIGRPPPLELLLRAGVVAGP